jgi:hypothetical protein
MDAVRGNDVVIAFGICVLKGNFDLPPVFGYASHRRFPTNCRRCHARAEKLHNVAAVRAQRASIWAPEAGLVDGEK